jgi:subtilisin-like proprotein convertase family protein
VVSNTEPIAIAESGQAAPYPSIIEVSGVGDPVADVNVTLDGIGHGFPDDVDVLLVGPSGDAVVLMADVGGDGTNSVTGLTLTFDDEAAAPLPDGATLASGSVRPTSGTDRGGGTCCDFVGGAPAPPPPYATSLSIFDGDDANGTWELFVFDDTTTDEGEISGGWSLEIDVGGGDQTATPTPTPTGATGVVGPAQFSSSETIDIVDSGQAAPYPSSIEVSGLSGTITDVNVTLDGFTHEFPADVDVLLVGPSGATVVLIADRGGVSPVDGLTLTFDDSAPTLPPVDGAVVSGAFRPERGARCCAFQGDAPAPPPPYGSRLSVFNGTDPNGTWSLFVFDDVSSDEGRITGGWSIEITTS